MMREKIVVVLMACMLTATVALTSAAGCTILNTGMNNEYNGSYYISQAWAKAEATNNSYIVCVGITRNGIVSYINQTVVHSGTTLTCYFQQAQLSPFIINSYSPYVYYSLA